MNTLTIVNFSRKIQIIMTLSVPARLQWFRVTIPMDAIPRWILFDI